MIHNNEVIAIEEDLLNYRAMIRQFTLHNRSNNLKIGILTLGATIVSCKLENGTQECIVNTNGSHIDLTNISQTNSRPNWVSHVRGLDTLSLTTGGGSAQSQSIVYQLTVDNQLILVGKFKNHHQSLHPHYFNLNSVTDKPTLDGHLLHVKSSDDSSLIQQLPGQNGTEDLRFNFAGDTPCAISDDLNDFDAIYCLSGNSDASLIATLQFQSRIIKFTVSNISNQVQNNNSNNPYQCRLRIRINNGGVSLMPAMMNEFKCIYKFLW